MVRLVIDDKIPFLKGVLEPYAEVKYVPGRRIETDLLKHADGMIIRTRTRCNRELLESTQVKFISTATIGFDHIDAEFCREKGIHWTNAPGCNSGSVMQYMASVLMQIEVKEQRPLSEMTLGIIGVGNVGKKVERLARALGMAVLLNDPPRARDELSSTFIPLEDLLNKSDIVTLHTPLNLSGEYKTFHLADSNFFSKMKPQSWFINASRGEVCNSGHLKLAHTSGLVKDFILDVWENEPEIDLELLDQCFIATPHIAGYSADGKANGTAMSVQACSNFFGFNLPSWYPDNIPEPLSPLINLTMEKLSSAEQIRKAILATYRVCEDDSSLRISPSLFEKLRGDYPIRREFPAFSVKMDSSNSEARNTLKMIGFNLIG
jgi:erythronate-4-phosphate dehydrogenase